MSMGGSGRRDDWTDGGGSVRPRYMAVRAPSPPVPNGHQAGERWTAYGAGESSMARSERRLLMLVGLIMAGVALAGAVALLAWDLWRLATAAG